MAACKNKVISCINWLVSVAESSYAHVSSVCCGNFRGLVDGGEVRRAADSYCVSRSSARDRRHHKAFC